LSTRDLFATTAPFVLLALALLVAAYWVLDPSPPRRVVSPPRRAGGRTRVRQTLRRTAEGRRHPRRAAHDAGFAENLALLRDPNSGVDLAFVQSGADRRDGPQQDADAGLSRSAAFL